MIYNKRNMTKMNWIVVMIGVFFTILGYAVVSSITRNYESMHAFIGILSLNLGLLFVLLGLSISFDKTQHDSGINI